MVRGITISSNFLEFDEYAPMVGHFNRTHDGSNAVLVTPSNDEAAAAATHWDTVAELEIVSGGQAKQSASPYCKGYGIGSR